MSEQKLMDIPIKTQHQNKKENDVYNAYKELMKELGCRAKGYSKSLLYEEVGEKFYLSGHQVYSIIKKKIKSERSVIC
jgi:hypothetical protein